MIGYGVASTAFAGLAITMVIRRESGVLKRIRATPLPGVRRTSLAVLASTFVMFLIEAVLLIVLGRLLFSVALPTRPFSLFVVLVLGAASLRGDGPRPDRRSCAPPRARRRSSTSSTCRWRSSPGTFFTPKEYPAFLRAIADVLPLTYFTKLTRDVMVRHHHLWSDTGAIAVVLVWGAIGLVAAIRGFRWQPRES